LALVEPSPVVIAALEVLSLRYAKDAKVGAVIRLAMRASDRQLRDAVRTTPHPPLAAAS
jgi:hypothetical protein